MKAKIVVATVVAYVGLVGGAYAVEGSFEGDIDGDLAVDAIDLSILTVFWLDGGCGEPDWCGHADLDRSHEVNQGDFAILARDWLKRIMTIQSHATHTENSGSGGRGPRLGCSDCHDTNNLPYFTSGNDSNGDGKYNLEETDVCSACHSPGGAFDGVNSAAGSVGGKDNWDTGVYNGGALSAGKEAWCVGCHDGGSSVIQGVSAGNVAGDAGQTWGFYANGHGRDPAVTCTECHDASMGHLDGLARTYSFDSAYYAQARSGVAYAQGYRLREVNGEAPLMIPANYGITFGYDAGLMRDTAFRLCLDCHDSSRVFDDTPGNGIDSDYKASLPNPPRNYSYAWGSGVDINEHVAHLLNYVGPFVDSDWDTASTGAGGSNGNDSLINCSACHNVHGAAGSEGSTNEAMIRDGSLAGRTGYGFSYVVEDVGSGGYPWVTSTGATGATSVGAVFRNNTSNMCAGSMCHGDPTPPAGSSYDAQGSSWGTYLEYFRP